MRLEQLQATLDLDRKSASHVLHAQSVSPEEDLDVGISSLLATWHILRTLGYSAEDSLAITKWFGDVITHHVRELYEMGNDEKIPALSIQLLDNRWVATSYSSEVYDLERLEVSSNMPPRALLALAVCVDEVYYKYVWPAFEPVDAA